MKIEFNCNGDENDTLTNINVAKALIEHATTYHHIIFNRDVTDNTFDVDDLEEIANHILVYCKAEKIRRGFSEENK